MIDRTFLKPYCVHDHDTEIERLCQDAHQFGFAMVAVNPSQVERCVKLLAGTGVRVGAAVGFPSGQTMSGVKAFKRRSFFSEVRLKLIWFSTFGSYHKEIWMW
jgi:deoxyribose-phosphate aldolase